MQRRAVPWVDWAEWRGVRDLLFAADLAQRRRGVQRVAAWRSRCAPLGPLPQPSSASSSPRRCRDRGRLPVSVECTGFIVEAWLSESALPPPSEVQLRLAYAMALLRLVNGICDPSQRGKAAGSVMALSRRLGLPPMLVDLRHAATHGSLPALAALRLGAAQAMEWLNERYWKQQHEEAALLESEGTGAALRREVVSTLQKYRKCREATMPQGDQARDIGKATEESIIDANTWRAADNLATSAVTAEILAAALLDGDLLVPKEPEVGEQGAEPAIQPWASSEVDDVFARLTYVWWPLVVALSQHRHSLRAALLHGAISRLAAEGAAGVVNAPSVQRKLRLSFLQRWAVFISRAPPAAERSGGSGAAVRLSSDAVVLCLRGMNTWVLPLVRQCGRDGECSARVTKLAEIGSAMASLRAGRVSQLAEPSSARRTDVSLESMSATLELWRHTAKRGDGPKSRSGPEDNLSDSRTGVGQRSLGVDVARLARWGRPVHFAPAYVGTQARPCSPSLELPEYINDVCLVGQRQLQCQDDGELPTSSSSLR